MIVKFKKLHPDSVMPKYGKPGDAGMDLTAISYEYDEATHTYLYKTGIAVEIPEGYVGLIFPRSSIYKTELIMSNSVGVIDSGYRGEIMFRFYQRNAKITYANNERIGQLIILPYPQIEFEEVEELSITERNTGGFGSTGL